MLFGLSGDGPILGPKGLAASITLEGNAAGAWKERPTLQVVRLSNIPVDEWELFDKRVGAPTFFARPAWALSLQAAHPDLRAKPLRLTMDDGTSVIVPMMESKTRLFGMCSLIGMPLRTYTAFVADDGRPADADRSEAAARHVLEHGADGVEIVPWPLAHLPKPLEPSPPMPSTAVIDLAAGFDACMQAMEGTARRMARQAERRGVICAVERTPDAASAYYGMLQESAKRWGRSAPTISKVLLDETLRRAGDDADLWIARYEGEPVAGGVAVYGNDETTFWTAAMRTEFSTLRPSNLLNVCMIESAVQRGRRWFNLGESEGLPGVRKFKESLGAVSISYPVLRRESARLRAYRTAGKWLRRFGRRTPDAP
jgi:CelD/BcsL family acetyltransferase involved in cellulose biosynthesis